ncbi:MAG: hypothetical protein Q8L05_12015 [Actinomycetota bacterium]|nr:hypothetical protein [Actinomycetota bacterium]MDP2289253.1 hypothetical protein [Actinomycetota bacterium]
MKVNHGRHRAAAVMVAAAIAIAAMTATQTAQAGTDNEPPVVLLSPAAWIQNTVPVYVPIGQGFDLKYQLKDDSGESRLTFVLYSGGTMVRTVGPMELVPANGSTQSWHMDPVAPTSAETSGPFSVCAIAVDASGKASAPSPQESKACTWLALEVPIAPVANGCGGQQWGPTLGKLQSSVLNAQSFGGVRVVFKSACDAHDAGYSGVTARDPVADRVFNYRTLSREWIDNQLFWDMATLCQQQLKPGMVTANQYKLCDPGVSLKRYLSGVGWGAVDLDTYVPPGAHVYYEAVRKYARKAYDTDSTIPGVQYDESVPVTVPPAGGRNGT